MDTTLLIFGGIALAVALVLFLAVLLRSRKVKLTDSDEDQPEWRRETPPPETIAATKRDRQQGVSTFDQDVGEHLAAPFAEQIEDILRFKLEKDPYLQQFDVDLGTSPDGSLEIWVNGQVYNEIEALPDDRLKQAFRQAVEQWNKP
jgi:hypothetical protein